MTDFRLPGRAVSWIVSHLRSVNINVTKTTEEMMHSSTCGLKALKSEKTCCCFLNVVQNPLALSIVSDIQLILMVPFSYGNETSKESIILARP
mmetsp:Transcript_7816/g.11654  ORF Transcript_7816/g.11654 Transcript_7816/m.11654 type:complete len:93 (+) Transcript_7816:264-542(+)